MVSPCEKCPQNYKKCPYKRGCEDWKRWFKAYWRRMRKKYIGLAVPGNTEAGNAADHS